MNPRLAATAALCREVALPASVLASIVVFGSAGIDNTGAAPIIERPAPSLADGAAFADTLPPISLAAADAAAAGRSVIETAAAETVAVEAAAIEATPAEHEPEPVVTAALTDPSEMLPPEPSPEQVAKSPATPEPDGAYGAVDSTEVLDECPVVATCIDRYLWVLYQHTPKEDAVRTQERRKVTVRKKGRLVTVTRTFTTATDEDFSWKDPKAAEKAGMPMADYVIGGMDRDFKLKLFRMLHAAEQAGLSPGITSAFRDDYRQSIASGLKAANDRSYHGGSFRGGYGHGLAADVVSVNGATRTQRWTSTETLWKWIDAHGQEFGIGRPYLDRDPPHVAPIDGKEYADHHPGPGTKARPVALATKLHGKLALHNDRRSTKPARSARSLKMRAIRPA
jgi:D-alanyl-D-alanine carboxypeptidase